MAFSPPPPLPFSPPTDGPSAVFSPLFFLGKKVWWWSNLTSLIHRLPPLPLFFQDNHATVAAHFFLPAALDTLLLWLLLAYMYDQAGECFTRPVNFSSLLAVGTERGERRENPSISGGRTRNKKVCVILPSPSILSFSVVCPIPGVFSPLPLFRPSMHARQPNQIFSHSLPLSQLRHMLICAQSGDRGRKGKKGFFSCLDFWAVARSRNPVEKGRRGTLTH